MNQSSKCSSFNKNKKKTIINNDKESATYDINILQEQKHTYDSCTICLALLPPPQKRESGTFGQGIVKQYKPFPKLSPSDDLKKIKDLFEGMLIRHIFSCSFILSDCEKKSIYKLNLYGLKRIDGNLTFFLND